MHPSSRPSKEASPHVSRGPALLGRFPPHTHSRTGEGVILERGSFFLHHRQCCLVDSIIIIIHGIIISNLNVDPRRFSVPVRPRRNRNHKRLALWPSCGLAQALNWHMQLRYLDCKLYLINIYSRVPVAASNCQSRNAPSRIVDSPSICVCAVRNDCRETSTPPCVVSDSL